VETTEPQRCPLCGSVVLRPWHSRRTVLHLDVVHRGGVCPRHGVVTARIAHRADRE
jgi:hypothetical protein